MHPVREICEMSKKNKRKLLARKMHREMNGVDTRVIWKDRNEIKVKRRT